MYPNRTDREKALDYAFRVYPYEYGELVDDDFGRAPRQMPIDPERLLQLADQILVFLEGDEVVG